ncbi:hypothetical protein HYU09_02805 [Candidatus Woesearchaeota archaeon]|nr:hypothetical protein [Candidatus Woesearchaeota archaeon]
MVEKDIPIGVLSPEFKEFLSKFHLARIALSRQEIPEHALDDIVELMDFLHLAGEMNIPKEGYDQEYQSNKKNLEKFIDRILGVTAKRNVLDFIPGLSATKYTRVKGIYTGDGPVSARTFEHDLDTTVLHMYSRVKDFEEYGLKTVLNVNNQTPTGFLDVSAFRAIIEHRDATRYRYEETFKRLDNSKKDEILKKFGLHNFSEIFEYLSKMKDFSDRVQVLEFQDLRPDQQGDYRKKFAKKNEDACIEFAQKLAGNSKGMHFVPIWPLYISLGTGIEARVQTQTFIDARFNEVFELDYIIRRFTGKGSGESLFDAVKRRAVGTLKSEEGGVVVYDDKNGKVSYLVDYGDLILNFHTATGADIGEIKRLAGLIYSKFEKSENKLKRKQEEGKHRSEEDQDWKAILDLLDGHILDDISLKPDDLPVGLYASIQNNVENIKGKYGVRFDNGRLVETCIRNRFDPLVDPKAAARGHRDVKVYPNFDPEKVQICAELQIRSPDSDFDSEFGKAAHSKYKKDRRAKLSMTDILFVDAFFGQDQAREKSRAQLYGEFYSRIIEQTAHQISAIGVIEHDKRRFDALIGKVNRYLHNAAERAAGYLPKIGISVESILTLYMESKGMDALSYADSLWHIRNAVADMSERHRIRPKYWKDRRALETEIHSSRIKSLFDAYSNLIAGDKNSAIAAIFLGRLISDYNSYYPQAIESAVQRHYSGLLNNFGKQHGWRQKKLRKKLDLGIVPARSNDGQAIHNVDLLYAIKNPSAVSYFLHASGLGFSADLLTNVEKLCYNYGQRLEPRKR